MEKNTDKKHNVINAVCWAFSLAWKFNKRILVLCIFLVLVISVLPAIALVYNKAIINALSVYIQTGKGSYASILPQILIFGIVTALIGLSNRINEEVIYSIMFDSYYFGMEEILMDGVQSCTMEELLQKDTNDEYHACVLREGSLTDFVSGFCTLLGRAVGFFSLLLMAMSMSKAVFTISLVYIAGVVWYNITFVEEVHLGWTKRKDKERLADYYERMVYSRECAKEIRIFKSKEYIIEKWRGIYGNLFKHEMENNLNVEMRTFYSGVGFCVFLAILIIHSLFLLQKGQMTPDTLLVLFTLCMNIYTSISGVARTILITDYGLYALERQYYFFGAKKVKYEQPANDANIETGSESVFEAEHLTFSYKKGEPVLDDVSFKVKKGETIALVGLNGSGKSTLIKLLLRLYKPVSGKIFYKGVCYDEINDELLRNRIGTFFQDFYLFHMSIRENVGFGDVKYVTDTVRVKRAVEKADAGGIVAKAPLGVNSFVHKQIEKSGVEFSGGESQKIAVARAYMSDKDVLIFDEPASMLDPIAELEQFMKIKNIVGGKTAILVSHRVGFARLADRIILLDGGKVAETGTHDELINRNGLYAKIFHEQAQWYREKSNA